MSMGVSGILLKEYTSVALDCVQKVAREGMLLPQDIVAKATHSGPVVTATKLSLLSRRERQIVRLSCHRLSNRTLTEQLRTSERAVGIHHHDIHHNLDNANRTMFTNVQVQYGTTQNGR